MLYAPVDGRIGATTVTNHSIAIATKSGIEVLIHIGIGTVNMKGKGFKRLVEANDEVHAGQPIMLFDVDAIKLAGYDEVIACVISNPDDFSKIRHVGASGTLIGDRPLVKIGDPLLVAKK